MAADEYEALVVGGGHNGLVASAYLARSGLRTLVLERGPFVGGASATEELWPGFKLQTAAYTYSLMRPVIVRELELRRHRHQVIGYDPSLFLPFSDGRYRCLWADHARTLEEIAKFSRKDAQAYERVKALFTRIARFIDPMLDQPPPDPRSNHPRDLFAMLSLAARARGLDKRDLYQLIRLLQISAKDIAIPSVHDDSLCPPGYHSCSVFVQYAPYHLRESDWDAEREKLGDVVVDTIAEYAPNLPDAIVHRQVLSPWDLEQRFGLTHGNIFQGELTPDQILFLRPVPGWARYRTPVDGLFLCGAGTHPGGGVMGACGRNAAREALRSVRRRMR